MSEDKDSSENLDNSIDGEFQAGGGAQGEDKSDSEGLGASSGSEADLRAKKQRMQIPSPKPSSLPFMVQGTTLLLHMSLSSRNSVRRRDKVCI